jgi:TPR repeat protein
LYYNRYTVDKNLVEASKWFRFAAEQGYAKAQYNLGSMYDSGEGAVQDKEEAVKWHRMAAEQELKDSQSSLLEPCITMEKE